jgi:hypothetical protein
MKLYVCYGTFTFAPRPGGHPCGKAYHALVGAGHKPDVVLSYGFGALPGFLNMTPGRREVKRLTGNYWVPVLVTDDETVVQGGQKIIDWAHSNPGGAPAGATSTAEAPAVTEAPAAPPASEAPAAPPPSDEPPYPPAPESPERPPASNAPETPPPEPN